MKRKKVRLNFLNYPIKSVRAEKRFSSLISYDSLATPLNLYDNFERKVNC